ncbi:MAG: dUTP diphosphatase [Maritimibacter sp.]
MEDKKYAVVLRYEGIQPEDMQGIARHGSREAGDLGHIDPTKPAPKLLIGSENWVGRALAEIELMTWEGYAAEMVDLRASIEQLAMSTIQHQSADIGRFAQVMKVADLSFDELFKTYVGKNVLNFFRQDHGYKEGSYIKLWNGREDNEYLAEILSGLDADSPGFSDEVYRQLDQAYPKG